MEAEVKKSFKWVVLVAIFATELVGVCLAVAGVGARAVAGVCGVLTAHVMVIGCASPLLGVVRN